MNAAVITDMSRPPTWATFDEPVCNDDELLVTVAASALSPLARSQAAGQHYSSVQAAAFVPGVDGIGRTADGRRVYFAFPRSPFGGMAERTPVRKDLCVGVPDDVDDATAAALANPGMSSWAALVERAKFVRGESVLINGATGSAGQLAIRIAKHLGARTVVVTGRNDASIAPLRALGADECISLALPSDDLVATLQAAIYDHQIGVVIDYLWGVPAQQIFAAIAGKRGISDAPRIRYVQVGAIAGGEIPLPAGLLRSTGIELLGSGLNSVPLARLVSVIGDVFRAATSAQLSVETATVPMKDVESAWNADYGSRRLVFTLAP
jgi:NADPH:quinone reductase-like Zn-dependent oxidoreductase